jgi:hypothetical protein
MQELEIMHFLLYAERRSKKKKVRGQIKKIILKKIKILNILQRKRLEKFLCRSPGSCQPPLDSATAYAGITFPYTEMNWCLKFGFNSN